MDGLRVQSLGQFGVFWNDEQVPEKAWETRKPMVVFAYLAWHGSAAPERLCADLWPDHGASGRQALQSTLARVRRALRVTGLDPLLLRRGAYKLNPALNLEFDAQEMQAALGSESLQRVRELYRGPFLEGFNDDWARVRRDELAQQFRQAMATLGRLLSEGGDHNGAIELYREVLQRDPLWELGHMGMLQALVALQQREQATRHYRSYVETLKSRLGLSPSAEMLRLYYTLRL